MAAPDNEIDDAILFYKDLLESFFTANYPDVIPCKFWKWFNKILIGRYKDISDLSAEEKVNFIAKLQEAGDTLFDSIQLYENVPINDL
jgi:hypothetical protein